MDSSAGAEAGTDTRDLADIESDVSQRTTLPVVSRVNRERRSILLS